ncbi:hypothetical protein FQN55_000108 [Onygenales sp. PD_40]|nr:hypothetical protein FQN55_000108 [Onygenales sp. PD_40]
MASLQAAIRLPLVIKVVVKLTTLWMMSFPQARPNLKHHMNLILRSCGDEPHPDVSIDQEPSNGNCNGSESSDTDDTPNTNPIQHGDADNESSSNSDVSMDDTPYPDLDEHLTPPERHLPPGQQSKMDKCPSQQDFPIQCACVESGVHARLINNDRMGPKLVISPPSLMQHWINEFELRL